MSATWKRVTPAPHFPGEQPRPAAAAGAQLALLSAGMQNARPRRTKIERRLFLELSAMDELVSRLVDNVGIDENEARRAIGIFFGFIKDAGPPDKVDRLLVALPEAEKVESPFDGSFGGSMGAMAAFNALTAAGLDMQEIQGAAREVIRYSKERAGDEAVDDVVRAIPGLSQYV